ncbi:MAG: xanthine dehydrogenase family protein molybdopterin-binding subunit, partial [Nitrososphaerota archaeon]
MTNKYSRRLEDLRFLTGHAQFIDDIRLPNMAHCVFIRSQFAHAKILSIDPSHALRSEGVLAFIDGRQVASSAKPLSTMIAGLTYYGIAVDRVRYEGEPMGMVLADSLENAMDAAEKVRLEYVPLEPVMSVEEAASSPPIHDELGSNILLQQQYQFGDVEKAFVEADEVLQGRFIFERYSASPIETCGVVASVEPSGRLVVYDNQQTPLLFKNVIAASLKLQPSRIRFVEPDIGGGFGVKIMLYPYVFLISFAALRLGRPVKWIETRREHLQAMSHSSNRLFDVEMALKRDGEVTALRTKFIEDCGAWVRPPDPGGVIRSLMTYLGCYRVRNVSVAIDVVVTNKCPTGPVRGYGCQHAYFMLERMMDIAAKRLGLSPVDIRLKNFVRPEEHPYTTPFGCIYDGGNYETTLLKAVELAHLEKYRGIPHIGVGIACVVEPAVTNLARNKMLFPTLNMSGSGEGVIVRVEDDGTISAWISSIPQGQGHVTVSTHLVCKFLGVKPEDVNVFHGDSDSVHPSPFGGTWGSRFSVMTVAALKWACQNLKTKILRIA